MMTKNELVTYLENRLSVLNKTERDDIINEYLQHIENKLSEGLTESEAVKTLGNIEDMVRETLSAYNVDPDYENNIPSRENAARNKIKSIISLSVNKFIGLIKGIGDYILGQKAINILMLIIKSLVLLFVLWLCFMLGYFIAGLVAEMIGAVIGGYYLIQDILLIIYIIIALPTFVYIFIRFIARHIKSTKSYSTDSFNESISDLKKSIEKKQAERAEKKETVKEKKEIKVVFPSFGICKFIKSLVIFCFKLFIICCIFPIICGLFFSIIGFGALLVFLLMGYPCIGFTVSMLGINMAGIAIVAMIIKAVFFRNKEVKVSE